MKRIFNPTSVKQVGSGYLIVPVLLTYLFLMEFFTMLILLTAWNVHFPKFNLNMYFECIVCVML